MVKACLLWEKEAKLLNGTGNRNESWQDGSMKELLVPPSLFSEVEARDPRTWEVIGGQLLEARVVLSIFTIDGNGEMSIVYLPGRSR